MRPRVPHNGKDVSRLCGSCSLPILQPWN
jgi:hypothetical protein